MRVVIPFALPGLNEYIEAERAHRQKGAALKRSAQASVELALKRQIRGPLREPVVMRYTWMEKDRRRDKDNVSSFGRKVIQDAMVHMGALKNDGWANIESFSDVFAVDRKRPRIEIEIEEENMSVIPILTDAGLIKLAKGELDLAELPGCANCPHCGKFFNPAHAARKPRFCEDCGAELRWPD